MLRKALTMLVLGLAVMAPAAAAEATGYNIDDFTFDPGTTVSLSDVFGADALTGWAPGEVVEIFLLPDGTKVGEVTADASGSIAGELTIPADTELGVHVIELRGNDANGAARVESVEIVVFIGKLPATGSSNIVLLLGVGALAFAIGSGLVATNRRREASLTG